MGQTDPLVAPMSPLQILLSTLHHHRHNHRYHLSQRRNRLLSLGPLETAPRNLSQRILHDKKCYFRLPAQRGKYKAEDFKTGKSLSSYVD